MRPRRRADPDVEAWRERLATIDRSLVVLLRAREQAQRELLALKRARALPLIDLEQEREVGRRARSWADELGGDPDLAAQVVLAALGSGKRRFFEGDQDPPPTGAGETLPSPPPTGSEPRRRRHVASVPGS